jgi:xylulokinase
MGERGPQHDPQARGVLYGLTLAHRRGDVTRAALEGCACQLRRIVEALGPAGLEEVVTVGGGAKSLLWRSIIADVLGRPLLLPRVLEAGALGAAILAAVGAGVYPDVATAARSMVRVIDSVEPDPERCLRYTQLYAQFVELESRVAPLYGKERP